jgi:hypothetical protein
MSRVLRLSVREYFAGSSAAILIVLTMLSLLPVSVSAVTRQVTDFSGLQAAVSDDTVDTILIMQDVAFTERINIERAVTIRGGECTMGDDTCRVTLDGGGSTRFFYIPSGGDVVFSYLRFYNVSTPQSDWRCRSGMWQISLIFTDFLDSWLCICVYWVYTCCSLLLPLIPYLCDLGSSQS